MENDNIVNGSFEISKIKGYNNLSDTLMTFVINNNKREEEKNGFLKLSQKVKNFLEYSMEDENFDYLASRGIEYYRSGTNINYILTFGDIRTNYKDIDSNYIKVKGQVSSIISTEKIAEMKVEYNLKEEHLYNLANFLSLMKSQVEFKEPEKVKEFIDEHGNYDFKKVPVDKVEIVFDDYDMIYASTVHFYSKEKLYSTASLSNPSELANVFSTESDTNNILYDPADNRTVVPVLNRNVDITIGYETATDLSQVSATFPLKSVLNKTDTILQERISNNSDMQHIRELVDFVYKNGSEYLKILTESYSKKYDKEKAKDTVNLTPEDKGEKTITKGNTK